MQKRNGRPVRAMMAMVLALLTLVLTVIRIRSGGSWGLPVLLAVVLGLFAALYWRRWASCVPPEGCAAPEGREESWRDDYSRGECLLHGILMAVLAAMGLAQTVSRARSGAVNDGWGLPALLTAALLLHVVIWLRRWAVYDSSEGC